MCIRDRYKDIQVRNTREKIQEWRRTLYIVGLVKALEIPSINVTLHTQAHTHAHTPPLPTHTHHDCNQLSLILSKIIFLKCLFKKKSRWNPFRWMRATLALGTRLPLLQNRTTRDRGKHANNLRGVVKCYFLIRRTVNTSIVPRIPWFGYPRWRCLRRGCELTQPHSQGFSPQEEGGRKKTLASAGHVIFKHSKKLGVIIEHVIRV